MNSQIKIFIDYIKESIKENVFVKLTLSKYHGAEGYLKNIYVKRIHLKSGDKLSFTFRYQTQDIIKNYTMDESVDSIISNLSQEGFHVANLFTLQSDYLIEFEPNQNWKLKRMDPSTTSLPSPEHDKQKVKKISIKDKHYLNALGITDIRGNVLAHAQDKYKQINHYVEILSSLFNELPTEEQIKIVDMGSGKGYLTFALYDYLTNVLHRPAEVTGIEVRKSLVELCNAIAKQSNFERLNFEENSIDHYTNYDYSVLIALHACDTATDDAIAHGITAGAKLIVVAPCCHKQIRRQITKSNTKSELEDLIRHGIFLERQAEMITDSIRALIMEYYGYTTKIMDFISDAHTPKNIMITAQKNSKKITDKLMIIEK